MIQPIHSSKLLVKSLMLLLPLLATFDFLLYTKVVYLFYNVVAPIDSLACNITSKCNMYTNILVRISMYAQQTLYVHCAVHMHCKRTCLLVSIIAAGIWRLIQYTYMQSIMSKYVYEGGIAIATFKIRIYRCRSKLLLA